MQIAKENLLKLNLIKIAESLATAHIYIYIYTNVVLILKNTDAIFASFKTVNKKQFNKIFMFC